MNYIVRDSLDHILKCLSSFKVVAIVGPRQVGKSTLATKLVAEKDIWLDLERPSDLRKLDDPETYLTLHSDKLVCIDEIQLRPNLFPVLRSLCDDSEAKGRFLILGSASPDLLKQSSETLAGRIKYIELSPFSLNEAKESGLHDLWLKGGYPESYLAANEFSFEWREAYIKTFLERDLAMLGYRRSPTQMRRFWTMLAHLQGQALNQSKIAGSLDTTAPTVKSLVDMMVDTFMVRVLPPWHKNIKKRLVKSPKVYIRDSGILHSLLSIETMDELQGHPILGASFEGFAIEQVLTGLSSKWNCFYYRSAVGEELDLILQFKEKLIAIEIKCSRAPTLTKNNRKAIETVNPDQVFLLSLVEKAYQLDETTTVTNLKGLIETLGKYESR